MQHLHTAGRDLDLVIVEIAVPLDQRDFLPGQIFRDKILNRDELGLRVRGFEQQTLQHFRRDALAVVVEGASDRAVRHHMRRLNVNIIPLRR